LSSALIQPIGILVDRWIGEGRLPTLRRLRENGVWGPMAPPPGLWQQHGMALFPNRRVAG